MSRREISRRDLLVLFTTYLQLSTTYPASLNKSIAQQKNFLSEPLNKCLTDLQYLRYGYKENLLGISLFLS